MKIMQVLGYGTDDLTFVICSNNKATYRSGDLGVTNIDTYSHGFKYSDNVELIRRAYERSIFGQSYYRVNLPSF